MKQNCLLIFGGLLFVCIPIVLAQTTDPSSEADPRIDKTKPIAYLLVDHIGPRDPIVPGESTTGIYLKLQNNSRIPLVVATVKDANKNALVPSLHDEVIPNKKFVLGGGMPWMPSPGIPTEPGWDDLQAYPNEDELAVRAAEFDAKRQARPIQGGKRSNRPSGYGWDLSPMLTAIPPGGTLLFSLPVSHVSSEWHIEIPFRFGLEHDQNIRPPYSYLALFWEDLPEEYRTKPKDGSTTSKPMIR